MSRTNRAEALVSANIGVRRKEALRKSAEGDGISVSDLLRRLVDAHLGDAAPKPPADFDPPSMVL